MKAATGKSGGRPKRGSALVIVLWITLGLVSLVLYFGHSMTLELRASDNRLASLEAEQAIEGAARYAAYLLSHLEEPGRLPELQTYQRDGVAVGEAMFWFLGRDPQKPAVDQPVFSLVDEASKLNLNTATQEMLEALPGMTAELAAAIIDWRDADNDVTDGGAEEQTYLLQSPSYRCKNGRFESVDELRLVIGANADLLYGEDWNRNGVLDPNENDGAVTLPQDNRDGRLDPGLWEYVTVYSRESGTSSSGTNRVSVSGPGATQRLAPVLQSVLGTQRANQILQPLTGPNGTFRSPLEFYLRSHQQRQNGISADEFARIEDQLSVTNGTYVEGLVNVNTASEAVLACLPGVGVDRAATLVSHRQTVSVSQLNSVAWVADVLDTANAIRLGPYITAKSYQFAVDVAAVGRLGRGYRRTRFIFDSADGTPKIVYRQDLSHLGWALGRQARLQTQQLAGNRTMR